MRVAVGSGKGGTGKTTVSTNLALCLARAGRQVMYADCDVEEPNGHIFLKPELGAPRPVHVTVPDVDASLCTGCGRCGEVCQYGAIVCVRERVLTFPELCHGCDGCRLLCPADAIRAGAREVGVVEVGRSGDIEFVHGRLRIGEAMSPPLIRQVKKHAQDFPGVALLDAPPGTSCPVITALMDTDYVILVTEPTPFGLNDLVLAVETVRLLGMPFGVIVNRSDVGDDRVLTYCRRENIDVLLEIPDDRRIAEAYSRGIPAVDVVEGIGEKVLSFWGAVEEQIAGRPSSSVEL